MIILLVMLLFHTTQAIDNGQCPAALKVIKSTAPSRNSTFSRVSGVTILHKFQVTKERTLVDCALQCDAKDECPIFDYGDFFCYLGANYTLDGPPILTSDSVMKKVLFLKIPADRLPGNVCMKPEAFDKFLENIVRDLLLKNAVTVPSTVTEMNPTSMLPDIDSSPGSTTVIYQEKINTVPSFTNSSTSHTIPSSTLTASDDLHTINSYGTPTVPFDPQNTSVSSTSPSTPFTAPVGNVSTPSSSVTVSELIPSTTTTDDPTRESTEETVPDRSTTTVKMIEETTKLTTTESTTQSDLMNSSIGSTTTTNQEKEPMNNSTTSITTLGESTSATEFEKEPTETTGTMPVTNASTTSIIGSSVTSPDPYTTTTSSSSSISQTSSTTTTNLTSVPYTSSEPATTDLEHGSTMTSEPELTTSPTLPSIATSTSLGATSTVTGSSDNLTTTVVSSTSTTVNPGSEDEVTISTETTVSIDTEEENTTIKTGYNHSMGNLTEDWYHNITHPGVACNSSTCWCDFSLYDMVVETEGDSYIGFSVIYKNEKQYMRGEWTEYELLIGTAKSMRCKKTAREFTAPQCYAPIVINGGYNKNGVECNLYAPLDYVLDRYNRTYPITLTYISLHSCSTGWFLNNGTQIFPVAMRCMT